ncbi:PD-(D/E)XK nuclease family protein [Acetohalobium arabaticum]|uniref:PD-(D/E)XK endonuclease-like domain-containing protein n=1 Tax=Acetohalobium arabaticum (strain ATCC 49924 / DSM 5501 / Z-7288) TaxID=574087 RepID=D9QQW7_ACEAZ|nr:PD-(D/E)XK nuclease family protein [Acetohalobium arabaticum]ADL12908.1 conserved hypothetical protein [Acetohalobium arabaticum DSM 5501]
MEINYVDYFDNLLEAVVDDSRPRVYVFNNYATKLEAKNYYCRPFLALESEFLMMSELKERLFPGDRLQLKEEKLVIIFYELLTEEDKQQLGISDYNDVIDLANDFFNFYEELAEYKVDEIEDLRDWQQEKYDIFQDLRKRYIAKMEELDYTDKTLSYETANFSLDFLQDFDEVVFVNVLEFTPLEKEIVSKLEVAGQTVQLYNQIKPEDYDEETLQLKSVTLPDELEPKVEIYQIDEDLLQLVNALVKVDEAETNYTILDGDFENSNYHNLLSSSKIKVDKDVSFTKTRLFRFLESLYTLLKNADFSSGGIRLRLGDLVEASHLAGFRDYYSLDRSELNGLNQLAQEDYVYFCEELIDDQLAPFRAVVEEIEQISGLRSLSGFCSYLEGLVVEKLADNRYKNDLNIFFGSLAELNSITEMGIVDSWNQYFTNNAQGLFLLILRYLRFKRVETTVDDSGAEVEVKDLLTSSFVNRNRIMMLNVVEGIVPRAEEAAFLLTESQRTQVGLKTYQQQRLEMKYKFFRHLLSSEQAVIFSLKNEEQNIAVSSFIEELQLKYNLPTKEVEITGADYPEIIKSIFDCDSCLLGVDEKLADKYSDRLEIEAEDFANQRLSLTYYKYSTLKRYCSYRFYLEQLAGLEAEQMEFSRELSPKVLGILVHRVFEEMINRVGDRIKDGGYKPEKEVIKEVITEKVASFDLKIPGYYEEYYEEVIFKAVQESVEYFLTVLPDRVKGNIKDIVTEWMPAQDESRVFMESEEVEIQLNGRIDLVIETDESKHIIDYKTGRGNTEQLDLYSLLYNQELEAGEMIDKSIYNVMDQKFDRGYRGSEERFRDKLRNLLEEAIIDSKEYQGQFKSRCKRCDYIDICKVGWR